MANLETLELTINANAESASRGLSVLINSLSALSDALVKPYSDLRDFNSALKELKNNAKIKFNISGAIGSINAVKKAAKKAVAEVPKDYDWGNQRAVNRGSPDAKPYDQWKKQFDERTAAWKEEQKALEGRTRASEAFYNGKSVIRGAEVKAVTNEEVKALQNSGNAAVEAGKKHGSFVNQLKNVGNGLKEAVPKFQLFNRILRIASTMLIRMGLRALFKGIKEGFNNYYEYSKKIGNTFAKDMDDVYSTWAKLKNQMGASLAPIISAALPVINSIANAAVRAFNAISQLFALLSGKNSWSAATEQASEYSEAIGGAGGKTKELLAQFDELNVIASESGGGGGGAAADATTMFQEMYEFDEKIRALVDFIKSNMNSIKGIAVAIGTSILAWKLADAFAETLPLLSKIFGYVAAGAVVAITLQVTWMLTNQYLNTNDEGWLIADIFTTAIGATAAASIAQHFIGGNAGAWFAAVTLAFSAITGIKALLDRPDIDALSEQSIKTSVVEALKMGAAGTILFIAGGAGIGAALAGGAVMALATFGVAIGIKAFVNYLSSDGLEWGSVQLTQQQVQDFVNQKMFKVDVDASIERINTTIEATAVNKTELRKNLSALIGTLDVIKLGIDNDYTDLKVAVNAVIATVEKYIQNAKEMGKLTLQFTPTLVGSDEGEQGDWFANYTTGWDYVDNWFKTKGEELGKLLVENEQSVIVSDETKQKLIQALSEQLAEVTDAISKAEINSAAYAGMASGIGDLTQASAHDVLEAFAKYKEDLTAAYTDLVNEQYIKQGELVAALFAIDPNSDEYKKALADYEEMGKNIPKAIKDGVDSASESGNNLIRDWINGLDFDVDMNTAEWRELIDNFGGTLDSAIEEAINAATNDPEVLEAAKLIGLTGWDLLKDDMKQNFIDALTLDQSTINQLKQASVPASDIFKFSDWASFSNDTKLELIQAITNAYGANEALQAAKNAGINIADLLEEGMKSTDTKGIAKDLLKQLNGTVSKGKVTVPDAITKSTFFKKVLDAAKAGLKEVKDYLKNNPATSPNAKAKDGFFGNIIKAAKTGVKEEKEYLKNNPATAPNVQKKDGFFDKITGGVEKGIKDTQKILSGATLTVPKLNLSQGFENGVTDSVRGIMNTVSSIVNGTKPVVKVGVASDGSRVQVRVTGTNGVSVGGGGGLGTVSLQAMAKGGILNSGTVFVAGENGLPEMVGEINGHTGVANQDQIVEGIRKGVSDAQSEQNTLLRQQNDLLRAILAKDNGMKASAALGRIASQSIGMYNSLVGG